MIVRFIDRMINAWYNSENINVNNFHFEVKKSKDMIKLTNLNVKNVKIELYGKVIGGYPLVVGIFGEDGLPIKDIYSNNGMEFKGTREDNAFVSNVYEKITIKNGVYNYVGYNRNVTKNESAYDYLCQYPSYIDNRSSLIKDGCTYPLIGIPTIKSIGICSTARISSIEKMETYHFYANGMQINIYDLGDD